MSDRLILAVVGLIVIATIIAVMRSRPRAWHQSVARRRLMTAAEVRFWHLLCAALPHHGVFAQVAMGALLKPVEGLSRKGWWSVYGRFSQMIVDFVVVDGRSGEVVAIVELDDRSHDSGKDAARDALLVRNHYSVIRFANAARYDPQTVRARLAEVLDLSAVAPARAGRL